MSESSRVLQELLILDREQQEREMDDIRQTWESMPYDQYYPLEEDFV